MTAADPLKQFLAENPNAQVSPWGTVGFARLTSLDRKFKQYGILLWWHVGQDAPRLNEIWRQLCPVVNRHPSPRQSYMQAPAVRAFDPKLPDLGTVDCWFPNQQRPPVFDSARQPVEPRRVRKGVTARAIFTIQKIKNRPIPFLVGVQAFV